jgi:hypothetical protein
MEQIVSRGIPVIIPPVTAFRRGWSRISLRINPGVDPWGE